MLTIDDADQALAREVRPPDWAAPEGRRGYDLVVIGGGTAGLVSAAGAAGLGARVALIERSRLGGDCLNTGCVPSKAIIRSARAVGEIRRAASLGVFGESQPRVDFAAVMQRMRERRAAIARHDSAARLRDLGVDVFFGDGRFTGRRDVAVNGRTLRFNRAVVATGGRPALPPIPGLAEAGVLTSETVFNLTERPARLIVIGAGPVGCELAQAFARFGSAVVLLESAARLLPRDDEDASALLAKLLTDEGVAFEPGIRVMRAGQRGDGAFVQYDRDGRTITVEADAILVAAGRAANVDGLGLDAAGVASGPGGITVDDRLRTSNHRIFAAGDVCSTWRFTHAADAMARLVIQNALFYGRGRVSRLTIPWCTYTDPEVAHVGLSETGESGSLKAITIPLAEVDRSIIDDETSGFVKLHHERGRLRGCTIVAPHAGEMIGYAADLVARGTRLSALASAIQPYPTVAAAFRQAGDRYRRGLLSPAVARWMERYFRWTRGNL